MRRLLTPWVSMALVVALVVAVSPLFAGNKLQIIDTPEPFPSASSVAVTVKNTSPEKRKGVVTVHATVDGQVKEASATVIVNGGAVTSVVVSFAGTVQSVVDTGIIEDPDPIPM